MPNTNPPPLQFYLATATKRFCLNSGFVEPGTRMFVAKWQKLYIVAKDSDNFFLISEDQAPQFIRTERDEQNKLKPAQDGPVICPTGPSFQWTVESGSTCPDDCDETAEHIESFPTQEEAILFARNEFARQQSRPTAIGNDLFIRIRGPVFYKYERIRRTTRAIRPPDDVLFNQAIATIPNMLLQQNSISTLGVLEHIRTETRFNEARVQNNSTANSPIIDYYRFMSPFLIET
jgi:hypothetical protein